MISLARILLVEDDPNDAELALEALAEYHLANEVLHLRDGAEALDYLYRRGAFTARGDDQPSVVLLDLKMPKVDGMEVLQRIKADPDLMRIPVVIMTSSKEEKDMVNGYGFGANAYIVKPVQFQSFVEAVKCVGAFWALLNEPPPGSLRRPDKAPGEAP